MTDWPARSAARGALHDSLIDPSCHRRRIAFGASLVDGGNAQQPLANHVAPNDERPGAAPTLGARPRASVDFPDPEKPPMAINRGGAG